MKLTLFCRKGNNAIMPTVPNLTSKLLPSNVKSLLITCCVSCSALAQVQYEQGYFIDNNNNRVECLIKNEGWYRNPTRFQYKLNDSDKRREEQIESIREFGVSEFRFFRESVAIDVSSQNLQRLSIDSAPKWETRTVFLQLLVDGPAKLFRYRTPELQVFFFSVNASPVKQLVYKRYSVGTYAVSENNFFQSQLRGRVACNDMATLNAGRLKYQVDDLSVFFTDYNKCKGFVPPASTKAGNLWKSKLHFSITPGYDIATATLIGNDAVENTTPQPDPGYRLGAMVEFELPFNRNKWSFIVEPTFQSSFDFTAETAHRSVELPFGVRHNFYIGQDMALFLNAMVLLDFIVKYQVSTSSTNPGLQGQDKATGGAAAGAGVRWRYLSIEPRYYFTRLVIDENRRRMDYSKLSIILAVRVR